MATYIYFIKEERHDDVNIVGENENNAHTITRRERPRSVPYLRLNKTQKPRFPQLESFFEVSCKSHSAEKCRIGTL